jgi:hypothetical protein
MIPKGAELDNPKAALRAMDQGGSSRMIGAARE